MAPNSAIEWSFLRRRGWHTAEKLYLLRGQSPLSLTLPLAHSSPGSSPGSNGPNPLAGDWAGMRVMKIHHGCPRRFQRSLEQSAFRSEAEEGAFRRRWASWEEAEAGAPEAYSLYAEDADAEG
jgi:hypothetical protein